MKIEKSFVASDGWLSHWKKKYSIKHYTVSGEKKSADIEAGENFKVAFRSKIDLEELQSCQIFNADETGFNFKMLPKKTLSEQGNRVFGFKQNKERLTVMVCSNADGSCKLPLVVIGKSAKPRPLKDCINSLPVYYTHQKKAWMNSLIFETWFKNEFIPKVTKFLQEKKVPIKAVLLLDNAPSHPPVEKLDEEEIKANYFPPNTTPILQPMDQGIIENLKRNYKKRFLKFLLSLINNGTDPVTSIKTVNIKHVITWLNDSWMEVSESTIFKCWKNVLPPRFYIDNSTQIDDPPALSVSNQTLINQVHEINGLEDVEGEAVVDWVQNGDEEELTIPTNLELIDMVRGIDDCAEETEENADLEAVPNAESVNLEDVVNSADKILDFCKKNKNFASNFELEILQKIKEKALNEAKNLVL